MCGHQVGSSFFMEEKAGRSVRVEPASRRSVEREARFKVLGQIDLETQFLPGAGFKRIAVQLTMLADPAIDDGGNGNRLRLRYGWMGQVRLAAHQGFIDTEADGIGYTPP